MLRKFNLSLSIFIFSLNLFGEENNTNQSQKTDTKLTSTFDNQDKNFDSEKNDLEKKDLLKLQDSYTISLEEQKKYEEKVENKRILPFYKELAEDAGVALPLPIGISYLGNYSHIKQTAGDLNINYERTAGSITIEGDGFKPKDIDISWDGGRPVTVPLEVGIETDSYMNGIMIDTYLLPFLNVYMFIGDIQVIGDLEMNNLKGTLVNVADAFFPDVIYDGKDWDDLNNIQKAKVVKIIAEYILENNPELGDKIGNIIDGINNNKIDPNKFIKAYNKGVKNGSLKKLNFKNKIPNSRIGDGDINIGDIISKVKDKIPDSVKVDYRDSGLGWGGGFDLYGGYKDFFADFNVTVAKATMTEAGYNNTLLLMNPRIGYQNHKYNFEFWVGALYSNKSESLSGNIGLGNTGTNLGGFTNYDLNITKASFIPLVGIHKEFFDQRMDFVWEWMIHPDRYGCNLRVGYRM